MGLPAKNKFNKDKAPAADKGKAKPGADKTKGKKKKASRFGGEDPSDRPPMLEEGDSRIRLVAIEEGHNPGTGNDSYKVRFETVEYDGSPHDAGFEGTLIFMDTGRGRKEYKDCIRHFAGYDDAEEFEAFDPEYELCEAVLGADNDYSAEAEQMIGRVVDVRVTKGGATADGTDWYRRYQWAAVEDDDDDQNVSPKIEK